MKSLHDFMIIMKNDNAQQKFVNFIVAICCINLKKLSKSFSVWKSNLKYQKNN